MTPFEASVKALFALLPLSVMTCSGENEVTSPFPRPGGPRIEVRVNAGGDFVPPSYRVSVNSDQSVPFQDGVATLGASLGTHNVRLEGMAENCSVIGGNPRAVNVTGTEPVELSFEVSCQLLLTGRIAFHHNEGFDINPDGNLDIYTMNADGSDVTRLTNHLGWDDSPEWSPNGTEIVFRSERTITEFGWWWNGDVFVMDENGGNQRPILTKDEDQGTPSWAKNGRIAFIDVDPFDVYWMNSDGSGVVNVTNTPGIAEYQPAWSPDGTKIAYSLHPRLFADADISDPDNADIWVSNADGSHPVNITNHPGIDYEAAWSPDGSQIVFRSNRNGFWDLFVISANGTRLRQLTGLASSERTPSWSPDGSMIVFASSRVCEGDQARGDHEIFVMNADGTGITCITRNSLGDQSPAWKP